MSGIKELRISGVRSFAPDGDPERVKFDKPLTLILGQNGCGKTTIIECLKYAITGELPPGSNNGKSFIHHPKVNKSREVSAKVMLKVTDAKGIEVVVSRNSQVTATAKDMTFKTLDSSISRKNPITGKKDTISSKCIETDEKMCNTLGVSKAILSNVIFCHQEDSNWPLDEGKKLKERFDAIFDATKYNKCYENIRKLLKKYSHEIDVLAKDVEHWTDKKKELDNKRLAIATTEEKISNAEVKLTNIREELIPIRKRRLEIEVIEKNFIQFETKKQSAIARLENCISQQSDLKKSIKLIYQGSIQELQREIDSFNTDLKVKECDLKSLKSCLDQLINKEEKYSKDISTKKMKVTELTTLEGQNQERVECRNKAIEDAARFAGIQLECPIETETEAKNLQTQLLKKQKSEENELSEEKEKANIEEKKLQTLVDQCRDAKARHIQKILSKETEINNFTNDKEKLTDDILEANQSKYKLDKLKGDLEIAESDFKKVSGEMNVELCQSKIDADEIKIEQLEADITILDQQITKLRKQNEKRSEIEFKKESVSAKQKTFNKRKNKHMDSMQDVLGEIPEENFTLKISSCDSSVLREIQQLDRQLEDKKHEITTLETERKNQKIQLARLQDDLSKGEEDIYALCRRQPLEEVLQKMDNDIEKLQKEKGELSASRIVIKKYIDQVTSKPNCPLCHRPFEEADEAPELATELRQKIENIPEKLDAVIDKLSRMSEERDRLVAMKPLNERIRKLRDIDIPKMKQTYETTDESLNAAKEEVENLSMVRSEPERKQSILKHLAPDMPLLDDTLKDIKLLTKEITKLEAQLDDVGIDLSIDEANEKERDMKSQLSELRSFNKNRQNDINTHNKKLHGVRDKKNRLKEEYLNIQGKVQEICSLEDRLNQVTASLEKAKIELKDFKKTTDSLETELKCQEKNRELLVNKMRNKLDSQKDHIGTLQKNYVGILQLNGEIEAHERRNVKKDLENLKQSLEKISKDKAETIKEKEETASKLESCKDDLAKQEVNKRGLDDNLRLKNCEIDQKSLEATIQGIQEKLGELNCESLSKEKVKLINEESSRNMERARTEGGIKELKEALVIHRQQVKEMTNVEDRFRSKFYEYHLMKTVKQDLGAYAAALDFCLMQFHKERMERINFIIRDMWRNIYRGNDIDYIEIRTNENTSAASTVNGRKTYDYRVVQCRNDVEIDMRGRCSAGQKVLACLIIRMALAETFSTKFGVLALDEPTTNLDRENINSLCQNLSQIVSSRMQQMNFMFIIITHDLEFLTALGRVDKLDYYNEVTRDKDGKSVVRRVAMK